MYNFKRAFGIAIVLYIATFVVALACGLATGQDMSSMSTISDSMWYEGMAAAMVLTALFSMWYFKSPTVKAGAVSGLLFGLTIAVVSTLLDLAFFSLGNTQGANVDLGTYYGDYRFWIIIFLVLATAKWVGYAKRTKTA